jgi:GxxExxY protein
MKDNEITEVIIGSAIEVHKHLGPGLLESAYEAALCRELSLRGIEFQKQVSLPVEYKGIKLDCGYRLDLLIEKKIIVEIKAVETLGDIHMAQLLTYLKLMDLKLGLIINFNVPKLVNGVKRVSNKWKE